MHARSSPHTRQPAFTIPRWRHNDPSGRVSRQTPPAARPPISGGYCPVEAMRRPQSVTMGQGVMAGASRARRRLGVVAALLSASIASCPDRTEGSLRGLLLRRKGGNWIPGTPIRLGCTTTGWAARITSPRTGRPPSRRSPPIPGSWRTCGRTGRSWPARCGTWRHGAASASSWTSAPGCPRPVTLTRWPRRPPRQRGSCTWTMTRWCCRMPRPCSPAPLKAPRPTCTPICATSRRSCGRRRGPWTSASRSR